MLHFLSLKNQEAHFILESTHEGSVPQAGLTAQIR